MTWECDRVHRGLADQSTPNPSRSRVTNCGTMSSLAEEPTAPIILGDLAGCTPRALLEKRRAGVLDEIHSVLKKCAHLAEENEADTLRILEWMAIAFRKDMDAAFEFGLLGGHKSLLKLLESSRENVAAAAGDVVDSCMLRCPRFPMQRGLSITNTDRHVPLELLFDVGAPSVKKVLVRTVPKAPEDISVADGKPNSTVGYYLWDSAIKLAWWITQNPSIFEGKTVMEVGSGVGLPGVLAASYARKTFISDFHPKIVETAAYNIQLNSESAHEGQPAHAADCCIGKNGHDVVAMSVDWDRLDTTERLQEGDEKKVLPKEKSVDVMLGSDVICQESDCVGVARMLDYYLTRAGQAFFVLGSDENRYGVGKFRTTMESNGFDVESMDAAISVEACEAFLNKNQNFNSRPHDTLEMFLVRRTNIMRGPLDPETVVFFDCDDCLYQNDWKTAKLLTAKIDHYCTSKLGLDTGYAYHLYKKYGTCLRGLTEEKIIPDTPEAIDEFLENVHDVPLDDIRPNPALRKIISAVKYKRWVFTASVESHAQRCLDALGISDLFLGIIDVKKVGLVTKHSPAAFARAMKIARVTDPSKCIFTDDSSSNITAAKKVGWRTVVVGPLRDGCVPGVKRHHPDADFTVDTLLELPDVLPGLFL